MDLFLFTLKPILLYLACAGCSTCFGAVGVLSPSNVTVSTLNMNLTIQWDRPENIDRNETLYYTVYREPGNDRFPVDECENITRTFCSLNDLYPEGTGFYRSEWYFIESRSDSRNGVGECEHKLARRHINVSAPVIYNYTVTSRSIKVKIHGPETPFTRNGEPIYMGDEGLGGNLGLESVKFNTTLYDKGSEFKTCRPIADTDLKNGFGEVIYSDLKPYTNYKLKIQSKLNRLSKDVTILDFQTKTEAPDVAPIVSSTEITGRNCDYRDVTVTWKDMDGYESNGPLTNYFIHFKKEEEPEFNYTSVPSTIKSVVLSRLYRWTKYIVKVSSANRHGRCVGRTSYLDADAPYIEMYKATSQKVSELSKHEWRLSWTPPEYHSQCIVGYRVITFIDGDLEEDVRVHGFNTSSANLHFKKTGRYQIEIIPITNDSLQTKAISTVMYNAKVKSSEIREWMIFTGVAFLMVVIVTAVVVMTKKVFCDYSNLPNISNSRSMKIAKSIRAADTSLKAPPTREHFDATRLDVNTFNYYKPDADFSFEDNVLNPKSTSTSFLLSTSSSSANDECNNLHTLRSEKRCSAKNEYDERLTPSEITSDKDRRSRSPLKGPPKGSEGYVAHALRTKKHVELTVTIPGIRNSTHVSSPSSSSDSGISSSTYLGSVSDYQPSPPLSEVDENSKWVDSGSVSCTDCKSQSPYVATDLAVRRGRIDFNSLDSAAGMVYKKLDSREPSDDERRYLPMNPVAVQKSWSVEDKQHTRRGEQGMTSSMRVSIPYSKLSSKEVDSTSSV